MSALDILTIVLDAASLTKTSPNIASTSDVDIIQIKSFINQSGKDISRRADFAKLIVNHTLTGGSKTYSLPESFKRIPNFKGALTLKKTNEYAPVIPVESDEVWGVVDSNVENNKYYYADKRRYYYYLTQGNIQFSPALDNDGANLKYISKYWVNNTITGSDEVSDNGDVILLNEELIAKGAIWRWFRRKGLPYQDYMSEFEADLKAELLSSKGFL